VSRLNYSSDIQDKIVEKHSKELSFFQKEREINSLNIQRMIDRLLMSAGLPLVEFEFGNLMQQ